MRDRPTSFLYRSLLIAIPIAAPVAFAIPALAFAPTLFASFAKFVALMIGLTAVKAVTIDFALELPFVLLDVALALVKVLRLSAACGTEQEKPTKRCGEQRRFPTLCKSSDVAPDHNGLPATAASAWNSLAGAGEPVAYTRRTPRPGK